MTSRPSDFVRIAQIHPDIRISARYHSGENFMGRVVPGYMSGDLCVTHACAEALLNVQNAVEADGCALVIYDAYRPQKAVDAFGVWAQDAHDHMKKAEYYPYVDKARVNDLGYVAKKSTHSRGSTVDLTLISKDKVVLDQPCVVERTLKDGRTVRWLDDGTVDMYTHFDLFDEASHHDTDLIDTGALFRRNHLRGMMERFGFKSYKKEWWHYQLIDEPYPQTYFDFDV